MENTKLLQYAKDLLKNSYSPYSNFPVSAILEMVDGTLIYGVNIENSAFGATNCAERSALFSAYSQGYSKKDIKKLVVMSNLDTPISPCGICRQVISELLDNDTPIILGTSNLEFQEHTVASLLPYAFSENDLERGKKNENK